MLQSSVVRVSSLKATETRLDLMIHVLTVTGIFAGMASLISVLDNSPSSAIVWMMIAVAIDGIDGPIARKWMSASLAPRFDGFILDLVIDYATCVIVPCAFMWQFGVVTHGLSGQLAIAAVLGSSAMWFSQTKGESDDHWFSGFPAAWNLVVPTLWILDGDTTLNVVIALAISWLTLSKVEFPHTIKVKRFRIPNVIASTIWMVSMIYFSFKVPNVGRIASLVLFIGPITITTFVLIRIFEKRHTPQEVL
ncbi:MAG TPA: hypothetical protein DCL10_03215 [Acidimicrobium sp.]|jgi:phosphatidylcholine synthase|nr:hypothetical protein [Acidimicrobium sp.]